MEDDDDDIEGGERMDLVRNIKRKRWWIDGFCKGVRTLERETKVREIWSKMAMGVETPMF